MKFLYTTLVLACSLPMIINAQHAITGDIVFPNALPICEVLVELRDDSGLLIAQDITEADGTFEFTNVAAGTAYTLLFSRDGSSPLNGTSTFDLVLLARRILGIDPIQPYDVWIGDVNNSGAMTTLDMIIIRKLILYIDTTLPVPPWAFDSPEVVSMPDNQIELPVLNDDVNVDVIGVKRADFNYSAHMQCN